MRIEWKIVWSIYATIGIPFLYIYNIYLAYAFPQTLSISLQLKALGFFLAIFGVVIWIVSYIHLGLSFGVLPQKQKRVTTGLYKHIKHPMYIAIWCTFVGLSVANASLPGLMFLTLIMTPLLVIRATIEDKQLL